MVEHAFFHLLYSRTKPLHALLHQDGSTDAFPQICPGAHRSIHALLDTSLWHRERPLFGGRENFLPDFVPTALETFLEMLEAGNSLIERPLCPLHSFQELSRQGLQLLIISLGLVCGDRATDELASGKLQRGSSSVNFGLCLRGDQQVQPLGLHAGHNMRMCMRRSMPPHRRPMDTLVQW